MSTAARRRNGRLSALGLAASAAAHLCVIGFLAWSIRPTPDSADAPPLEVSLWSAPAAPRIAPRRPVASPPARAEAAPRPPPREPFAAIPEPIPLPAPAGETVHATDAVRGLLRASVGCDLAADFHLTADELGQCRRRAHRLGEDAPAYAVRPHDARKLAAFDRAAQANQADLHALDGPMKVLIPLCAGPGSNIAGGCLSPHYKKGVEGTSEADQRSVWH